jgi:hypothetical protein
MMNRLTTRGAGPLVLVMIVLAAISQHACDPKLHWIFAAMETASGSCVIGKSSIKPYSVKAHYGDVVIWSVANACGSDKYAAVAFGGNNPLQSNCVLKVSVLSGQASLIACFVTVKVKSETAFPYNFGVTAAEGGQVAIDTARDPRGEPEIRVLP